MRKILINSAAMPTETQTLNEKRSYLFAGVFHVKVGTAGELPSQHTITRVALFPQTTVLLRNG
jgi:hypothetical protein